jgi:hypothetical protein
VLAWLDTTRFVAALYVGHSLVRHLHHWIHELLALADQLILIIKPRSIALAQLTLPEVCRHIVRIWRLLIEPELAYGATEPRLGVFESRTQQAIGDASHSDIR